MTLPVEVVRRDNALETAATKTNEELAKHRWHWTLDESNPLRVGFSEYARAVARNESTIRMQARGYVSWRSGAGSLSLSDAIERAKMSTETEAATEAVAQARGIAFKTARENRPTEVKRVRDMARDRAERKGTTVEEEAPAVAEMAVKIEKSNQQQAAEHKAQHTFRYISIEGKLARMLHIGTEVLKEADNVGFDEEERELLADTIGQLKALLGLIDMRFAGQTDVDWDAELAKLGGGEPHE